MPTGIYVRAVLTIEERLFRHRWLNETGCWVWTGKLQPNGYAMTFLGSRAQGQRRSRVYVHRLAYELWRGPIPSGLDLDHLCRVRSCFNPAHLEPVTRAVNTRRGDGPALLARLNGSKTHCKSGHPFTAENTRQRPTGGRTCRTCEKEMAHGQEPTSTIHPQRAGLSPMPKRIDKLTEAQRAQMDAWADKWIEVGLRTGPTDWELFERAARDCYAFAGMAWPDVVVHVSSPLALAFAAPAAALAIELIERGPRDAVGGAVRGAVRDAVGGAVEGAVEGAVGGAVGAAVGGAVRDAVGDAVEGAVEGAVGGAVGGAVRGANTVRRATMDTIGRAWSYYLGGQFWVGGWYWGGAWTSFFREVCDLELPGDLWMRARAYEATLQAACWWWPHRRFVMVSARPTIIHREVANPAQPRGWGSHRLHCAEGPAVAWPDGWGLWYWHGVRVTRQIIEAPETLTVDQIEAEPNAEVRRVMVERFGAERYILESGAQLVHSDECGALYRREFADDEALVMVHVVNSTPEPDGSSRKYMLRVPPTMTMAREAVAWTFGLKPEEYEPAVET